MQRRKAFTLIELLVVISIIGLLIGILLPALGAARATARRMEGSTKVRGIHQAMVLYAQGNGGNYPGRNETGATLAAADIAYSATDGNDVQSRYAVMLEERLVPPAILISPSDTTGKVQYQFAALPAVTPVAFNATGNYSFSLLNIDITTTQRRPEWADSTNSQAIVVSDRLVGATIATVATYDSIHSQDGWSGSLGWNDNHVTFRQDPLPDTVYGTGAPQTGDNMFIAAGLIDAHMIIINDGDAAGDEILN